ncbi:MAG: GAF domain-containing protein, partial [Bacteroidota bacterium]|nr:GAF domain-containing protein [Bacteroidota bacterium]
LVKNEELVLGPFQGPIACTRIAKGKGVCGKAWELNEVIVVDDVDQFPGHIACNALSKSEIVLPVRNAKGNITAILDVDSDAYNSFDGIDEEWLRKIVQLLS